jgi:hypothetical protein
MKKITNLSCEENARIFGNIVIPKIYFLQILHGGFLQKKMDHEYAFQNS